MSRTTERERERDALRRGEWAYAHGQPRNSNPFRAAETRNAWWRGWDRQAELERRREGERMRKTCAGCRALQSPENTGIEYRCGLGYPQRIDPALHWPIPLATCPKPRTWADWIKSGRYAPPPERAEMGKESETK